MSFFTLLMNLFALAGSVISEMDTPAIKSLAAESDNLLEAYLAGRISEDKFRTEVAVNKATARVIAARVGIQNLDGLEVTFAGMMISRKQAADKARTF